MTSRRLKVLFLLGIGFLLHLYLWIYFLAVMPGTAIELDQLVRVPANSQKSQGAFLLTAVASERANLVTALYSLIARDMELVFLREEIPPGMDLDEYMDLMNRMMQESIMVSQAVAFKQAQLPVQIDSTIIVEKILPDSPAEGLLTMGDEIIGVDGQELLTTEDLIRQIQERSPGEPVTVGIVRQNKKMEIEVPTVANSDGKAVMRIMVGPHHNYQFPVDIQIDAKNIGGSSAGLMFALEVLDQLTEQDLTQGWRIAGTGSLRLNGHVDPIGGVKQKVVAAQRANAHYFFAPMANLDEANILARNIQVVGIENIEDALEFLSNLAPK